LRRFRPIEQFLHKLSTWRSPAEPALSFRDTLAPWYSRFEFRNVFTFRTCHSVAERSEGGGTCFPVQRHSVSKRASLRLKRPLALSLCLITALSGSLCAGPKNLTTAPDPDYVLALSAANHFLHAWQANDQETGILMLTDQPQAEDA
jgi:hypothetical protein